MNFSGQAIADFSNDYGNYIRMVFAKFRDLKDDRQLYDRAIRRASPHEIQRVDTVLEKIDARSSLFPSVPDARREMLALPAPPDASKGFAIIPAVGDAVQRVGTVGESATYAGTAGGHPQAVQLSPQTGRSPPSERTVVPLARAITLDAFFAAEGLPSSTADPFDLRDWPDFMSDDETPPKCRVKLTQLGKGIRASVRSHRNERSHGSKTVVEPPPPPKRQRPATAARRPDLMDDAAALQAAWDAPPVSGKGGGQTKDLRASRKRKQQHAANHKPKVTKRLPAVAAAAQQSSVPCAPKKRVTGKKPQTPTGAAVAVAEAATADGASNQSSIAQPPLSVPLVAGETLNTANKNTVLCRAYDRAKRAAVREGQSKDEATETARAAYRAANDAFEAALEAMATDAGHDVE